MLDVLYSDNHLLAVNKPAGLLTQPSGTDKENIEDLAKEWVKQEKNKPGDVYLHTIHRLDKPVSGVVLFARTSKALSRLNQHMRERKVSRVYHAVVDKPLPKLSGTCIHFHEHKHLHAVITKQSKGGAKEATLHYCVLKNIAKGQLVEVTLETGRYHQIRAQLGFIGSPIRGDELYGSGTKSREIFLHHYQLGIVHPVTKEELKITAPYPASWSGV